MHGELGRHRPPIERRFDHPTTGLRDRPDRPSSARGDVLSRVRTVRCVKRVLEAADDHAHGVSRLPAIGPGWKPFGGCARRDRRAVARWRCCLVAPTRVNLAVSIVLGTVTAVLVVGQAWLLATIVSGAFVDGAGLAAMQTMVVLLLGVVVLRALVAWYSEVAAARCSAQVKSELRRALVARAAVPGPRGLVARRPGDVATLAGGGIDVLDAYYSRYLPHLVLAMIVPPMVIVAVGSQDWISAAIIVVTVPLIPVFMALIGFATRRRTDRQLRTLQVLSGHFLDVVAGLSTLRIFGRSTAQTETIRSVTDRYRQTTMGTLRLAFLSSLALETGRQRRRGPRGRVDRAAPALRAPGPADLAVRARARSPRRTSRCACSAPATTPAPRA